MKQFLYLSIFASVLFSCNSNESVEVGNKTTMEIEPEFNAGDVQKGEIIHATFHVKNTGNYPLVIASVQGSCSCTVASKPDEPIQPGEETIIKAEVNTDKTPSGEISKPVTLVANTEKSIVQVLIKANVINK